MPITPAQQPAQARRNLPLAISVARQKGVVLFIALIVLVAMTLAGADIIVPHMGLRRAYEMTRRIAEESDAQFVIHLDHGQLVNSEDSRP